MSRKIGSRRRKIRRLFIQLFFQAPYMVRKLTCTGPFGHRKPIRLEEPIQAAGNPLKAALVKHHVKQYHEASCSVATVVAVVNALREIQTGAAVPVRQLEILENVPTANWKARMSAEGDKGKRGLPLQVLGEVVKSSLEAYAVRYKALEVVTALKNPAGGAAIRTALRQRLNSFEKRGDCLIIAHFNQGVLVQAPDIPHISPVGGFDDRTGGVTVLDVDPEQENPYQVSFETFYKGLASDYCHLLKPFGFGSGGYLFIDLKP